MGESLEAAQAYLTMRFQGPAIFPRLRGPNGAAVNDLLDRLSITQMNCQRQLVTTWRVALRVGVVLLLLGASASWETDSEAPGISRRINAFTLDLLKHRAANGNLPPNAILSPQSLFHGLAISYIASGGETRKELHQAKFTQQDQTSKAINGWVSGQTHGRIPKVVGPEDLTSRSRPGVIDEPALISVNAIYFKADWGSQFEKGSTRQQPFHVDAGMTVETPMMHQRSLLPYSENDTVQFLELPYIAGGCSMYVLLPHKVIGVSRVIEAMTVEMITDLKRRAAPQDVDVLLPKFEMRSHLAVKDALEKMGVKAAFDNHRADFDQMIIKRFEAYRVYLREIYHDAWIEVHEEGTRAAAATTTVHHSFGCSAPQAPRTPVQFHADHPFLFLIVHNQSRSILFAGWISNPDRGPLPRGLESRL